MSTKKITSIAMLTAIAVLLNVFTINTGVKDSRISFIYIPAFIGGVFISPFAGFAIGFIGDLLGGIYSMLGPYNPIIGIASGLLGLIPGLIFKYLKINDYLKIVLTFVATLIICTAGINTFALFLMYSKGKTYWAYLVARLPFQIAVAAMNATILILAWKPLQILNKKYFLS